ncbi:hypothetical protein IWQ60_000140 [Tieghemiomyces parasiticus]|uniref:Uncharacterized protein n=1 Tax=Tieghemiomyces parasiticus TaxID=78921 RepID=A0A9W8DXW6_9FUNG|nr:hypothetical protein IWQ60_000140 [Tieghemiomyces parasiticus]
MDLAIQGVRFASFALGFHRSVRALQSGRPDDIRDLVAFWVVVTLFGTLEGPADATIAWLPFYAELKTVLLALLALPPSYGITSIYAYSVQPTLDLIEKDIDYALNNYGRYLRNAMWQAVRSLFHSLTGYSVDMINNRVSQSWLNLWLVSYFSKPITDPLVHPADRIRPSVYDTTLVHLPEEHIIPLTVPRRGTSTAGSVRGLAASFEKGTQPRQTQAAAAKPPRAAALPRSRAGQRGNGSKQPIITKGKSIPPVLSQSTCSVEAVESEDEDFVPGGFLPAKKLRMGLPTPPTSQAARVDMSTVASEMSTEGEATAAPVGVPIKRRRSATSLVSIPEGGVEVVIPDTRVTSKAARIVRKTSTSRPSVTRARITAANDENRAPASDTVKPIGRKVSRAGPTPLAATLKQPARIAVTRQPRPHLSVSVSQATDGPVSRTTRKAVGLGDKRRPETIVVSPSESTASETTVSSSTSHTTSDSEPEVEYTPPYRSVRGRAQRGFATVSNVTVDVSHTDDLVTTQSTICPHRADPICAVGEATQESAREFESPSLALACSDNAPLFRRRARRRSSAATGQTDAGSAVPRGGRGRGRTMPKLQPVITDEGIGTQPPLRHSPRHKPRINYRE